MGRYRRYLITLAIVAVLVTVYALAGFLAVPYFARKNAQDFVRQHYARTLSIGEIHFNPFSFNLDVSRVSLPDADGQTLLSFARLHVDLELATLWRFAPSFREILLEQPYVRAVLRPGGELNLADLGKGFPPAPPAPQKKSKPMRLYIQRFALIAGATTFEDRTRAPTFHADFKPIAFELRDFSTTAGTGNDYTLNAASPQGERLLWSGNLELAPLASHGTFEIADLKTRTLWSYLRASLPFEIDSGMVNIKGGYQLTSGGGPLSLGVDVHSTTITDLGIKPKDGPENYLQVARIEVDATRIDLNKHSVAVGKVQVGGGDIKAWMSADGRINLLDLLSAAPAADGQKPAAPAADNAPRPRPAPDVEKAPAWSVSVPDIALHDFKIGAEDRRMKPAAGLLLEPFNVHLAGFSTAADDAVDLVLDSGVNHSGKVSVHAHVPLHAGTVSAHLEASELPLDMLQPYIAHYTSMTLLKGALGLKVDLERSAAGALTVKGDTTVSDLRTIDDALKQDFIKWRALRVADIRYSSQPANLKIGSITAIEPYARVIVAPNRTLNITEILTAPGAAPPAATTPPVAAAAAPVQRHAGSKRPAGVAAPGPAAAPTPFPVAIGAVRIANGSANYADLWIKPSFAVGIQTLDGAVTGLSSDPKSRAKVELNGKLERYSPVHIGGSVNLLSAALFTDITMSFHDVDLTIVNPYSGHFVGYRINKGKLSVDVSYKIDRRQLDAKQHVVVDQLELGDEVQSPDAVHLPLKLAVALLRDRNGVIDLDLPMNGSLDDPKFRVGPIIWKIFVNIIVKAATAPFALLGHLFGGGEHVNIVEFAPGSAELAKPAQEQLTSIANALKERPQLKLDVPMVYSTTLDAASLAQSKLHAALAERAANSRQGKKHPDTAAEMALTDPKGHFKLLLEEYKVQLKDAPLPASVDAVEQAKSKDVPYDPAIADLQAQLLTHFQAGEADLQALGKARAQAIQDALASAGQIAPERIFIVNAAPQTAAGDTVKVELAVK